MQTLVQTLTARQTILQTELQQISTSINALTQQLNVNQAEVNDINAELALISSYIQNNP